MTAALREMRQWLQENGCTHVAMESTGIYWQPVYAVLDGAFELVVGNAHHIKNVPGRKTDVKDSEWIANLLRHGLIRSSFVPAKPVRELRDLLRYRRKLVDACAAERNRLLKLLGTANIKLSSVASNVFGVSGMAMLRALIAGTVTPAEMAGLARGRLRHKLAELELALQGCVEDHHRYLLSVQLRRIEAAEYDIKQLDARITAKLEPDDEQHQRLMRIPGVDWFVAAVIVAELGIDMTVFPSAAHAAAWAGICPGNYESPTGQARGLKAHGKRNGGNIRKGNRPPQDSPGHRGGGRLAQDRQLPQGQILSPARPARPTARRRRGRTQDPDRRRSHARHRRPVQRSRRRSSRHSVPPARHPHPGPPPQSPRLQGRPYPNPGTSVTSFSWQNGSCFPPAALERIRCFVISPEQVPAIRYIQEHTTENEPIFVGLSRHDKVVLLCF
jgi:transposase